MLVQTKQQNCLVFIGLNGVAGQGVQLGRDLFFCLLTRSSVAVTLKVFVAAQCERVTVAVLARFDVHASHSIASCVKNSLYLSSKKQAKQQKCFAWLVAFKSGEARTLHPAVHSDGATGIRLQTYLVGMIKPI